MFTMTPGINVITKVITESCKPTTGSERSLREKSYLVTKNGASVLAPLALYFCSGISGFQKVGSTKKWVKKTPQGAGLQPFQLEKSPIYLLVTKIDWSLESLYQNQSAISKVVLNGHPEPTSQLLTARNRVPKFTVPQDHFGGWVSSSDTKPIQDTVLPALYSLYLGLLIRMVVLISTSVCWFQLHQSQLAGCWEFKPTHMGLGLSLQSQTVLSRHHFFFYYHFSH